MITLADSSQMVTRVDWLHAPEPWVIFLLIVPGVLLTVWWLYRRETQRMAGWRRWPLIALRVAVILALIGFLFEPMYVRERVKTENSYLLVLVDESYSMSISDQYEDPDFQEAIARVAGPTFGNDSTRLDLLRAILSNSQLDLITKLRQKANVRIVGFAKELRPIADLPRLTDSDGPPADLDLSDLEATGNVTEIGESVYESVNELRGEKVSGVLLLSDGRDTGAKLTPEKAADRLARRKIPIYSVGIGNAEEPKDIRLYGLDVAEVVLENDRVPVDFTVVSKGYVGRIPVELKLIREGQTDAPPIQKFIRLEETDEPQNHRVDFTPRSRGKFTLRVEIPEQEGERIAINNFDEAPMEVIADKIKVLYVEGPPRYEYRYLKHALIRDPTMETQILLTSADSEYLQPSSPGIRPLSAFPRSREELFKYHLVILGDVSPDFFTEDQKEWLVEFVDDIGGGIVFISGTWYMPHKYQGDETLKDLFPVVLEEQASFYDEGAFRNEFWVKLTPEGESHPTMQFVPDPQQNRDHWERRGSLSIRLPGFYWFRKVRSLKPGAISLANHETERHPSKGPRPIFALQPFGRGRTFIALTDETWRWRRGVGNAYFYRFWGQVLRYTSAGRLAAKKQRFAVSTDALEYVLESKVNVLARVLDDKFKALQDNDPLDENPLEYPVFVQRVDPPEPERRELTATQILARPEFFEAVLDADTLGTFKAWIEYRGEEVASSSYRVVVPQLEYREPRMDRPRLRDLAERSGGEFFEIDELNAIPEKIEAYEKEIAVPAESRSLWDTDQMLLLVVALLTLEWVLRKLFRLV